MGICFHRTPIAAALLAMSGLGTTSALADGKFIVQPSLNKPAPVLMDEVQAAAPAPVDTGELSLEAPQLPTPSVSAESNAVENTLPGGGSRATAHAPTLAPEFATIPATNATTTAPATGQIASPLAMGRDAQTASQGGLQWIARSSLSTRSVESRNVGPLEIANPNYPAPTSDTNSLHHRFPSDASSAAASAALVHANQRSHAMVEERESPRSVLASLVSSQIMSGRPAAEDGGRSVQSIDNPPGWQAIGEELSQRLGNCEELINRKAYYSARQDAEEAMLYLVRVLDLMSNSYRSEPAWHAAYKALSEAEDFSTAQRLTTDSDFLRRVILSHETPVLKDADVVSLAPLAAAQHYRQYAEDKLIEAAQGHPWASEVAYALGRTYQSQADITEDDSKQNLRWRAITLYRGARAVAPSNATATNQLGFVLLQMDRPHDAREALVASINVSPSLAAYENLAEASRRLGDSATGTWAIQQAMVYKNAQAGSPNLPAFVEVDPRTFAAFSPYTVGPNSQSPSNTVNPYRTASVPLPNQ